MHPPFDIIETSGKAYIKAWEERRYLLRLALIPFLAKALFFGVAMIMGYEENILRKTLILLPAYFMEGWLIAHVARLVFFDERWPIKLSGNTEQDILYIAARGRAVFAAIIIYVLINMGLIALAAPMLESQEEIAMASQDSQPSLAIFLIVMAASVVVIWGFKFTFLHIPTAIDIPVKAYLKKLPGLQSSVYLLGAWLTCYVPFLLAGIFMIQFFGVLLINHFNVFLFIGHILNFAVHLAAMSVITICFTMILKQLFSTNNQQGSE